MSRASTSRRDVNLLRGTFKYSVPWNIIPTTLLDPLNYAESLEQQVHPDVIMGLKQWLAKDLFQKYEEFKESHFVTKKTAGIEIYRSIAVEVTSKYQHALKVIANGGELDDGYNTFLQNFTHAMEHKGRRVPNIKKCLPNAEISRGAVGTLPEMYNPVIEEDNVDTQQQLKDKLLKTFKTVRRYEWRIDDMDGMMRASFALQRKDILEALGNVRQALEQEEDDERPQERAISTLHRQWPLLFLLRWQCIHFEMLTGHTIIEESVAEFRSNYLEVVMDFLTSCGTDSAMRNLALRRHWQRGGCNKKVEFLLALKMVANHLNEGEGVLYVTAEKTTPAAEVKFLPSLTGDPTIVALDSDVCQAENFYTCLDQVVVLNSSTSEDAVIGLITSAFIFDAMYPESLKHTFEYIERVVCRLGGLSRRPQQVTVTTPKVLKLINDVRKFQEKFNAYSSMMNDQAQ